MLRVCGAKIYIFWAIGLTQKGYHMLLQKYVLGYQTFEAFTLRGLLQWLEVPPGASPK